MPVRTALALVLLAGCWCGVSTALPLTVWVGGRARTKGSMRHQGAGRMVEQVKGSSAWRAQVVETVVRTLGGSFGPSGPSGWWEAACGPVAASLTVYLPRPASLRQASAGLRWDWPISIYDGDLDKLERNVGDALTDTGVIKDDSQIVHWSAWKLWAPEVDQVGALVNLVEVGDSAMLGGLDIGAASSQARR